MNKISNVDEYVNKFAQDTGVLIETGSRFIANDEGWVRINAATDPQLLCEGMRRLQITIEIT